MAVSRVSMMKTAEDIHKNLWLLMQPDCSSKRCWNW